MSGFLTRLALFFVMLVASASPLHDEFIMHAPLPYAREIAAHFGMSVLQQIPGQDIHLVRGPAGVPAEQVINLVRWFDYGKDIDRDDDDDDDVQIELNTIVSLPELESGVPRLINGTAAAQRVIHDQSVQPYFGDAVRSAYVRQPAAALIRIPAAHGLATGSGVVAVIDTGIDSQHSTLRRWLYPGYDFVRNVSGYPSELDDLDPTTRQIINPSSIAILDSLADLNPMTIAILDNATASRLDLSRLPPGFGHGTMVAGLVHLVAPTSRIMPLKAFGGDGKATTFNILRAIYFAENNGAKVINMSLSLQAPSQELARAVTYVSERGVICVASAGNKGLQTMTYPAGLPEVIGVGSTDFFDRQSSFSNFGGNLVRVAAPGEGLVTPYPGGWYAAAWGTSFSAALVSGTVSLVTDGRPWINWEKADGALSEASPAQGDLGSGRIDAYRAVDKAKQF